MVCDLYAASALPVSLLSHSRKGEQKPDGAIDMASKIKKAYRKLCLKWHPDKQKGDRADDKFVAALNFRRIQVRA